MLVLLTLVFLRLTGISQTEGRTAAPLTASTGKEALLSGLMWFTDDLGVTTVSRTLAFGRLNMDPHIIPDHDDFWRGNG